MELYEHFIILVPLVVILVSVLFFCPFMKETSYDEVLAKQKKDLKLPTAKIDKKKTDKKKNKKKETQNGNIHESDSETAIRDFDLGDALSSEEEHVVPAPVIPAENTTNVRERKKKDKKPAKPVIEEHVNKEVNGTKVPVKKPEPVPVTKQPTPPPDNTGLKKKQGQKKQKNGRGIYSFIVTHFKIFNPSAQVLPTWHGSERQHLCQSLVHCQVISHAILRESLKTDLVEVL